MGIFGWFMPNVNEIEEKKDVRGLIKALGQIGIGDIPSKAVEAPYRFGEVAAEPLIQALALENQLIRNKAMNDLEKMGEPAIASLIRCLISWTNSHFPVLETLPKSGNQQENFLSNHWKIWMTQP